mgnify:CR=1 FL=1
MSSTSFSLNSEIVRAGAGAGKTTRLTQKIHSVAKDFFHAHGRWPKLVITTFTRKATQELRERLIIKACDEKDQEFLSFLTMPGQVHISTIHGVLGLFLRRYGHLLGWDTSFRIMGKAETAHLSKMVLRELIYDSRWELLHTQFSSDQLLELLNGYYESYLTFGQLKGHDHSSLAHLHCTYINRLVKDVQKLAAFIETQFTSQKWCEFATHLQAVAGEWVQRNNLNHPLAGEEALEVLKERAVKPRTTKDVDEGDNEFVTDELKKIRTTLAQEWLNPNHWLIFS